MVKYITENILKCITNKVNKVNLNISIANHYKIYKEGGR